MSEINVILAPMAGRTVCTTKTVYQYNQGMVLRLLGIYLPQAYTVDFANSVTGSSISQVGSESGVTIPDQFFVPGSTIHAWVVITGTGYSVTRYHIMIPISPRAVRTNEEPTPSQQSALDEAIAALNDAVDAAETAITHYPTVIDGYWCVWDVIAGEYVSTGVEAQGPEGETGPAGADGQDGVSPTVTVTDIEGGHRVTITDAEGAQTFDVMDGSSADNSVFIAEYGVATFSDLLAAFNAGKVLVCKYTTSSRTIYSALYSYQSGDGFRFSVRGQDASLATYWFLCRSGTGWLNSSWPYNAITELSTVESGDYLAFVDANSSNRLSRSNGLKFGTDSDKYLANDGTWQEVPDSPVQDVQVNGTSVVQDGVANVPIGSNQVYGVLMTQHGLTTYQGKVSVASPNDSQVKEAYLANYAVVLSKQHAATFYGLAKAAGADMASISQTTVGVYPEAQKSAISQMLNGPVTVSGTTPAITALPGVRYICGEVATLDITLPASGCVDVVFESGSTATVLTITPPSGVTVKWTNGFDPTALEANTTYELNIADGLGVAGQWT